MWLSIKQKEPGYLQLGMMMYMVGPKCLQNTSIIYSKKTYIYINYLITFKLLPYCSISPAIGGSTTGSPLFICLCTCCHVLLNFFYRSKTMYFEPKLESQEEPNIKQNETS
jgi:hypothetical protein